jgi:WD40 repeat protein
MIYFHLALLLHSLIISSLCNAMNESDCLSLVSSFSTKERILGIGFPTNDTVLTRHHYEWSTFCSKTGKQKINITNKEHIDDFALSKDRKIAIIDVFGLTVHDIETGDIIYTKAMLGNFKRVTFCPNNDTLGIYYPFRNVITIHTIEKEEEREEEYNTPPDVGQGFFAGNPINKEFIIGNKIVKCVTGNKDIITTDIPGVVTDEFQSTYNPDGTVIAIQCEDGYLFHKKNSQVHKKDGQDFIINGKSNGNEPYYSIAFHPKKQFAALLTDDNRIEFWDYTKETEKPLAIIELPNEKLTYLCNPYPKPTAFAPNGEILATAIRNTFYTVPTPEAAYYDDATIAQGIAFNLAIKNNPDFFIPQDIVKLITHKLSRVPDFQLPKRIKPIEKKQQQNHNRMCTIS